MARGFDSRQRLVTDISKYDVDDLVRRSAVLLNRYMTTKNTDRLREAAPVIVELRSRFTLGNGRVDWSGRTPGYREAIRKVYDMAVIGDDALDTVISALRYHVGNRLRERVTADELEGAGLLKLAPKQRLALRREAFREGVTEVMGRWATHQEHCTCACSCFKVAEKSNDSLWV